ncbi:MAG: lysophospholipid acyltransferase family protein [Pseudomonadota bacterium]
MKVHSRSGGIARFFKRLGQKDWVINLVSWVLASYVRLVHATSRWTIVNREGLTQLAASDTPTIAAFWHGRLAMMPFLQEGDRPSHLLITKHRDGAFSARTTARFGIKPIFGSKTKVKRHSGEKKDQGGTQAFLAMARVLKQGGIVVITPDGPRGPARIAADGIPALAKAGKAIIVPFSYSTTRRRMLNTWDRFLLPLPFSKGVYVVGEPIVVDRKADAAGLEAARAELERALNALDAEADRLTGHTPLPLPLQAATTSAAPPGHPVPDKSQAV